MITIVITIIMITLTILTVIALTIVVPYVISVIHFVLVKFFFLAYWSFYSVFSTILVFFSHCGVKPFSGRSFLSSFRSIHF